MRNGKRFGFRIERSEGWKERKTVIGYRNNGLTFHDLIYKFKVKSLLFSKTVQYFLLTIR